MTSHMDPVLNSTVVWSPDDHTLTLPSEPQSRLPGPDDTLSHTEHLNASMEDETTVARPLDYHPAQEPLSSDHKTPSHPPGMPPETGTGDVDGKHTGRATPDSHTFDPDDARESEPSPDVNLDFPSTEDVRRQGMLGEYVHPLAAAEAAPGRIYVPPQSGSVRSRGRVPDPLEVLPFEDDENPAGEFGERHVGPSRVRRPPHSSYYNGPPPLDSAYGSDPVGQIGVHFPREILRIERDYSGGELCQFHPTFPLELEGRVTPVQHQESMNQINEVLISAHRVFPSFVHNALGILTLYISTLFVPSHYDRVRFQLSSRKCAYPLLGNATVAPLDRSAEPGDLQPPRSQHPLAPEVCVSIPGNRVLLITYLFWLVSL